MTEEEWLTCGEPGRLLFCTPTGYSSRKARLLCCAACRRVWSALDPTHIQPAIEIVERHAGNLASGQALKNVRQYTLQRRLILQGGDPTLIVQTLIVQQTSHAESWHEVEDVFHATIRLGNPKPISYALQAGSDLLTEIRYAYLDADYEPHYPAYANLVRDVIPNPFHPNPLRDTWLTADVVGLARSIYAEYAFERLPILADALMDAGCEDERVLEHCRSEGPHVRGCWVVDMLLGKS